MAHECALRVRKVSPVLMRCFPEVVSNDHVLKGSKVVISARKGWGSGSQIPFSDIRSRSNGKISSRLGKSVDNGLRDWRTADHIWVSASGKVRLGSTPEFGMHHMDKCMRRRRIGD